MDSLPHPAAGHLREVSGCFPWRLSQHRTLDPPAWGSPVILSKCTFYVCTPVPLTWTLDHQESPLWLRDKGKIAQGSPFHPGKLIIRKILECYTQKLNSNKNRDRKKIKIAESPCLTPGHKAESCGLVVFVVHVVLGSCGPVIHVALWSMCFRNKAWCLGNREQYVRDYGCLSSSLIWNDQLWWVNPWSFFGVEALMLLCIAVTRCSVCGHVSEMPGSCLHEWRECSGSISVLQVLPSLWGITSQSQQAPNSDFSCSHTERFSILTCPWLKVDDEAAWRLLWV